MNLETTYLGFKLRSPLIASASPLTGDLDNLCALEKEGAGAVVLPSVFEEQLRGQFHDPSWSLKHGIEPYPAYLSYLPKEEDFIATPESHLERINKASRALSIPVIASLSGAEPGEWTHFAKKLEEAGADAIELSIYQVPTDFDVSASEIEDRYLKLVSSVRREISIPLAVKLAPFFTSFPHFAARVIENGADGLVLFNRLFNPGMDLEHFEFTHTTQLTTSRDTDLPIRWTALLRDRFGGKLAASSGVHTGMDALKLIAAGADVTMMCSALLRYGLGHIKKVETEMTQWLEARGHVSLNQIRGRMSLRQAERSAFVRANYIWSVADFHPHVKREAHGV